MIRYVVRALVMMLTLMLLQPVMASEFALTDINGKKHNLTDYKGKWVVVNYWATWCPPCLDELPDLVDFHEKHKTNGTVVLGVNYEDISEDELTQFIDENFISYPVLMAEPGVNKFFGRLRGLPTTFLISPQGERVHTHVGRITKTQLERIIAEKKTKL